MRTRLGSLWQPRDDCRRLAFETGVKRIVAPGNEGKILPSGDPMKPSGRRGMVQQVDDAPARSQRAHDVDDLERARCAVSPARGKKVPKVDVRDASRWHLGAIKWQGQAPPGRRSRLPSGRETRTPMKRGETEQAYSDRRQPM